MSAPRTLNGALKRLHSALGFRKLGLFQEDALAEVVKLAQREALADAPPNFGRMFFVNAKTTSTFCEACFKQTKLNAGEDYIEVWPVGGDGWLKPQICTACNLSIPVVVNGKKGV